MGEALELRKSPDFRAPTLDLITLMVPFCIFGRRCRRLLACLPLLFTCIGGAAPVINELFYHPPQAGGPLSPTSPEDTGREWLELHNPDPTAVDMSGWKLAGTVDFTFPSGTLLPAGGFLVVVADVAKFSADHPGLLGIHGPWTGGLGNIDDTVDLLDASGVRQDRVHYDTEGDWAQRRHVSTLDSLGYPYGWLWISDADGGGESLELVNPAMKHNSGQNWASSLPVQLNPSVIHRGGTPAAPNSVRSADAAPIIEKVGHRPEVPTHSQLVTVSADLKDEAPGLAGVTGTVKYRISTLTPGSFSSVAMHDDGLNGDETAGDGVFSANLPAQAVGSVVEYYVEARDAGNHVRTWPTASDDAGNHNANALYQVDDEVYGAAAPFYRIVMPPVELAGLDAQPVSSGNRTSQRYLATFVALTTGELHVRQQASVRIRGAGSRGTLPRSVRVDFLNAEPWQNNVAVNLNGQYSYLQYLGAQLCQAAGIVAADAKPVFMRWNGENRLAQANQTGSQWQRNLGMAVHVEPINRDFLSHHFAGDSSGNLYTKRGGGGGEWQVAPNLAGAAAFYAGIGGSGTGEGWEKQNNTSAIDFSDLHSFVSTMTANAGAPGPNYLANVGGVMDVSQWLKSLAVSTILTDGETNLTNGRDDDYSVYRGVGDPRFKLIFHDLDTILGLGDSSVIGIGDLPYTIFDMVEAGRGGDIFDKLVPLFAQAGVLAEYKATLKALLDGPFSKAGFDAFVTRSIAGAGWAAADIDPVKATVIAFMDARRADILGKIAPPLAVTTGPTVASGYPAVTSSAVPALAGTFDSSKATQVSINGQPATLDLKAGTWSNQPPGSTVTLLAPGAEVRFKDDGSDQGSGWRARTFADVTWGSGPSPLGYSPNNDDGAATVVGGASASNQSTHFTNYFRAHFFVTNPAQYSGNLTIRVQRDDGVVLYLNGSEVGRDNIVASPTAVTFTTAATTGLSGSQEADWISFTFPASNLVSGDNVLAAEVHQSALSSSDCRFNCEVLASVGSTTPFIGTSTSLNPGINRVVIEERDAAGEHLRFVNYDIWFDDGSVATKGGTLAASETWTAAGGPYLIGSSMTIGAGVTLTIQPGTTVYTANGIGITLTGTGRIVADGTESQHIRWTQQPGTTALAGRIYVNGSSAEQRFVWNDLEYFGGSQGIECTNGVLFFSHCTFTKTDVQYISFHTSSFIVEDSYFETYVKPAGYPPATYDGSSAYQKPEMLHGASGIPSTGYAIFRRNLFGHTFGFNDVIDFTGGNRPNAILQVVDNVFTSATDDHLDLDNTDAWITGNVFLHAHQDTGRSNSGDSSSSISGGLEGSNAEPSEWTIYGNLFYDVDHAVLAKGKDGSNNTRSCRFLFLNNTLYRVTAQSDWGSHGGDIAAFNFMDNGALLPPANSGSGGLIEQNIIWDAGALTANYDASKLFVTMNNNILPVAWSGAGTGNRIADPQLHYDVFPELAFPVVEREYDYQRLWKVAHRAFALCPGSPAVGTGIAGGDKGGSVFQGIQILGSPPGTTALTGATLTFGPQGTFNPPGSAYTGYTYGYLGYKYSVDGGAQSAEIPIGTPLVLSGLSTGLHTLRVWGRNDSANSGNLNWQAAPTVATWTVDPAYVAPVVIGEVLATNVGAYANGTAHPDFVELRNTGTAAVDLSGWTIGDDPAAPAKFTFPVGTVLAPGAYLVLNADTPDGNPGLHLGFSLDGDGESVILSKPAAQGGAVVDSVTFGLQIADLSVGRVGNDGHWALNLPTPGAANVLQSTSCPGRVLFNEWLANAGIVFSEDRIELFNPDPVPADIGGFFFSDTPDVPRAYRMKPLSFVPANGFAVLVADGTGAAGAAGANHLPFRLDAFYDWLVMLDSSGNPVDQVAITCAQPDVAEGRYPDGAGAIQTWTFPTIGFSNVNGSPGGTTTVNTTLVDTGASWSYNDALNAAPANDAGGRTWQQLSYTATGWKTGGTPIGIDPDLASTTNPTTGVTPFFTTDFGAAYSAARVTYYFRRDFTFTGNPATATLVLDRWIDDGYNLYLNGQRIDTKGTMGAAPTWATLAGINVNNAVLESGLTLTVPAGALVSGNNQLAAEVHQTSTSSGDLAFALKLVASETVVLPPTLDPVRQRMMDLMSYLRITEVMYDPANGTDYEFIELKNISNSVSLDLTGVRLTNGVDFVFPARTLAPGAYMVVCKDQAAFQGVYGTGVPLAGVYAGKLDNDGETIDLTLPEPWTANIQRFSYEGIWFPAADGGGKSLEIVDPLHPLAAWNQKQSWQTSAAVGGTPAGLNAVNDFPTWLSAHAVTGANADPDRDGLDNLVEYSLGLDPAREDTLKGALSVEIGAGGHLEGTVSLPVHAPSDVTYQFQVSSGLQGGGWTTINSRTANGAWSSPGNVATGAPVGGKTPVTVTDPAAVSGNQRRFIRLRVLLVP